MDIVVLLESPQGSKSSSRKVASTCTILQCGSCSVTLPVAWIKGFVSFPRGFPTKLSHEAFPQGCHTCQRGGSRSSAWESILGVKAEAVQGKQVPLEWTETSRGLLEWWHDAGVPLAFPVESASSCGERGTPGILSGQSSEMSLISSYEAETGLLWMWMGASCFL